MAMRGDARGSPPNLYKAATVWRLEWGWSWNDKASSKCMMSITTQIRGRPVRQTLCILLTAFAVRRARAVERRLGERGEEVRAEPGERYGGRGEGGGTCEADCVCAPELCKSCAAYEVRQRAGSPECDVLPCFAPRNETGWHVVAHLRSGRMGASGRPALRLPLCEGLAPHPDQTRRLDTRSHGRTSGCNACTGKGIRAGRRGGSLLEELHAGPAFVTG